MSIDSYANLKQAVQNFSHRTDISNVIDNFIELAENQIDTGLKLRSNETLDTLTASTASRFLALPARFIKLRRMSIVSGSLNYEITFRAPEQMQIASAAGRPKYYTITSQIEFDRIPDSAYDVEVSYIAKLVPLTATNTTNNVLSNYPDLYLNGCLKWLSVWEKDFQQAAFYEQLFDKQMAQANSQERKGRFGVAPRMMKKGLTP